MLGKFGVFFYMGGPKMAYSMHGWQFFDWLHGEIPPHLSPLPICAIYACPHVQQILYLFFVIPGAQPICLHRPTWPLDTSLRPGGGVWGGPTTGLCTLDGASCTTHCRCTVLLLCDSRPGQAQARSSLLLPSCTEG